MADKTTNYIEVPASEVRRRVAETVKWYSDGGRAKIEADEVTRWRNRYREEVAGTTKGWINKRPMSEEEIEAYVDKEMKYGHDDFGFSAGNTRVDIFMDTFDGYVQEMKNLAAAATGDYPMQVRTFLWSLIVAHSTEPVASQPTG